MVNYFKSKNKMDFTECGVTCSYITEKDIVYVINQNLFNPLSHCYDPREVIGNLFHFATPKKGSDRKYGYYSIEQCELALGMFGWDALDREWYWREIDEKCRVRMDIPKTKDGECPTMTKIFGEPKNKYTRQDLINIGEDIYNKLGKEDGLNKLKELNAEIRKMQCKIIDNYNNALITKEKINIFS